MVAQPQDSLTFPFTHAPLAFRYFWIFFVVIGLFNTQQAWQALQTHFKGDEELKAKYKRLFIRFALWTNLPWLVMGGGILLGDADSVFDFFIPSSGKLSVLVWWTFILMLGFMGTIRIYTGGAETLEKYPGLPTLLTGSAKKIKTIWTIGFVILIFAAVFLYLHDPWAGDNRVYSTKLLSDFPVAFPLFFILLWLVASWLVAQTGGWVTLAGFYGTHQKFEGSPLRWRSARLGWVNYNTCINLGASKEGLYISISYFFRFNHRPLFIPWNEIEAAKSKVFWVETVSLHFAKMPGLILQLRAKNVERLKAMAQTPDAFKGLEG